MELPDLTLMDRQEVALIVSDNRRNNVGSAIKFFNPLPTRRMSI